MIGFLNMIEIKLFFCVQKWYENYYLPWLYRDFGKSRKYISMIFAIPVIASPDPIQDHDYIQLLVLNS